MIDVEKIVKSKYPKIEKYPKILYKPFIFFLKRFFHEKDINEFLAESSDLDGFDFIESVLDYFNFRYMASNIEKENIPTEGRVMIIANHPLGALDALALLKLVSEVRKDIKIVANDMLYSIPPMRSLLLPIDNMEKRYTKESIKAIYSSLKNEEVVIIFPSGEVSRANPTGIKDTKWRDGFLKFAKKTGTPILPIFIKARNSFSFYTLSSINKNFSSFMLVDEMFKQKDKGLHFSIGGLIPAENLNFGGLDTSSTVKLLKKHLWKISKGKKGIFQTQKGIAHPESRQELKRELSETCQFIGKTNDHKDIYLFEHSERSIILKELGRLREVTFRKVGEGSGKKRDKDKYDKYYKHIILWDDYNLEIVGSYRIGVVSEIVEKFGTSGLYTSTLFHFGEEFKPYLENSIELGRSFVQPKYWGSRALDSLWFGIGAFLRANPQIKYMFGTVSLSNSHPKVAQEQIIYFYQNFFGQNGIVESKNKVLISETSSLKNTFSEESYLKNMVVLKRNLKELNLTIPTLFKQYTELCEKGGVKFLDFGVDTDFNNAIDGFILVDVHSIKENKRKRYIDNGLDS
ncbi:putative hemolysin [Thiovulum sp. ES]|nr:putative hemolysin [Thiovulum sp. ES]